MRYAVLFSKVAYRRVSSYRIVVLHRQGSFLLSILILEHGLGRQKIKRRQTWRQQKTVEHETPSGHLFAHSCVHRHVCGGSSCSASVPILQKSRGCFGNATGTPQFCFFGIANHWGYPVGCIDRRQSIAKKDAIIPFVWWIGLGLFDDNIRWIHGIDSFSNYGRPCQTNHDSCD